MRRYLFFPALLLLAAFLTDKAFYLGDFEDYFLRTASFVNYEHKEILINELESYLKQENRKKVMVMFGNSRTMAFDPEHIKNYYPDWLLFNFSVPGGNTDYYLQFMERFKKRGIKPEFIYFAVSPQGFNSSAKVQMDEVMLNGLSAWFVLKNIPYYRVTELSNYFAKKTFWNYQFRPKLSIIMKKLKNDGKHLKGFRKLKKTSPELLKTNLGSIPISSKHDKGINDSDELSRTAEGTWIDFFSPFTVSKTQMYFTESSLKISKEMGIPSIVLWTKVGPYLRQIKNERAVETMQDGSKLTIRSSWAPKIEMLARKYNSEFMDMNFGPTIQCDRFQDSSHMAGVCFPEFTDFIFEKAGIKKINNTPNKVTAPK